MVEKTSTFYTNEFEKKKKKKKIKQTKKKKKKKKKKKHDFLTLKCCAIHLCKRLTVLRSIHAQPPLLYLLNT